MAVTGARTKTKAANRLDIAGFAGGLLLVVALALTARLLKLSVYDVKNIGFGIPGKVLEYPLWAALIGLAANFLIKRLGVHEMLQPGFRTELFLKTGLVLLGAGTSFSAVISTAQGAIIQGLIMVISVFFFCWWLSGKFRLPPTLRAIMSTAVSICGVSAAIAAAGAVLAKKEETTYITALVIVVALPMMVLTPLAAQAMGLPAPVAGAWFGGNVDTTAAVMGAGTIYGETAQTVAGIVKQTQNLLIGFVAFALALYFSTTAEGSQHGRPSPVMIWQRFPKFVLGFIVASLLFTFGVIPNDPNVVKTIAALKDWAFCLAFVCMGLELSLGEFKQMGWSPVIVFLIVTVFNTLLALLVAWLIFGVWMPVPNL